MATRTKKTSAQRGKKKRLITPDDMLEFQSVSGPRISPDGKRVVFVHRIVGEKNEYVSNLWMVPADGGAASQPFTSGGKDSQPRWSPDGTRVAFVSGRKKPLSQVYVIGADGGEATALTHFPEGSIGRIKWSPDGKTIAVTFRAQADAWTKPAVKERKENGLSDPPRVIDHWWYRLDGDGYFDAQRHELFLVDARTGRHRRVFRGDTLGFFTFDFSPDSRHMVIGTNRKRRAGLRPWNDELLRLNIGTGRITPLPDLPKGPKDAVAWSPDGKWIAFAGRVNSPDSTYSTENLELWVCNARGGKARSLTGEEDYCLMSAPMTDTAEVMFAPNFQWHPDGKRLVVQIGWQGESHLASVPLNGGKMTFLTKGASDHTFGNLSKDGRDAAMTTSTTTTLAEASVARLSARSARVSMLTALNKPLLDTLDLAKPTSHWVTSKAGNRVQVWVMRPSRGRTGRGPAVLEIHGGPHAQYGVGFFHEFQVLAANGYTVVYSNPRGSKGYGRDHCAAIRGSWGGADWEDMQAIADFMAGRSFVNPKKMGVMGGSYGGYMTNWIIGNTNRFAGAITDRCVSNLVSMAGSSDFMDPPDLYFPGNFWDRPEDRWAQSPIRLFGNVKTPTLIIHSEGDLRCNIEQAEQVHAALSLRDVPCRLVRYPRSTSHGMSRGGPPDMRLHRLHQILGWWKKYLA